MAIKDSLELALEQMDASAKDTPEKFVADFKDFRRELLGSEVFIGTSQRLSTMLLDSTPDLFPGYLTNILASMVWNGYQAAKLELQDVGLEELLGVKLQ